MIDDKTAEHTPLDLCNNGTCRTPQVPDCSNQFCAHCCAEKCLGNCVRAVKQNLDPENVPTF